MNFEYSFKYNEQNILYMELMAKDGIIGDFNMVTEWLISDAQDGEYELRILKEFIEGSKNEEEFWGNAYIVTIKKDYSTIKWAILDIPDSCTLPTQMLYEILQIWVAKQKELREETTEKESKENK